MHVGSQSDGTDGTGAGVGATGLHGVLRGVGGVNFVSHHAGGHRQ